MILYHGSNVIVKNPKILTSMKGKDFGFGFYLTPIKDQAEKRAIRKTYINKSVEPTISMFEWDENIKDLKYKNFNIVNLEWLDFIINCRSNINFKHFYDIVEGKIADDAVGETILFVMEGIMKKDDALEKLKFQKINSQIAFGTKESLQHLKFIKSYTVK